MIKHLFKFVVFLWTAGFVDLSGYTYEYLSDGSFLSVHVLIVDPKEEEIRPVKAAGKEIARETVAALARRHGAAAAVNGGFWKPNGAPAGILKIDQRWLGTPLKPRGAIGWSRNGQCVLIDRLLTNYQLEQCPPEGEIEVMPASDSPYTTPEEWKELVHIVGGTPILVKAGNIVEDHACEQVRESFLINKHPRTAVGIRMNGDWIFVVVDGRFEGNLGGMTIKELAELMLALRCMEALNLDGGGSSTLVVEGEVVNEPCGSLEVDGKHIEAVSDAILILPVSGIIDCPSLSDMGSPEFSCKLTAKM